ncbi:Neurotransmitter-gated ion-channel ligand binding domain protein [Ancylostoma ceylanicum]|uniref:Neurotransmitter-gated ion-channel ligand binding domain protein n=1 Tax=Ancylostoma ceylanicum TaxID=53326 RepID=A0A0D6LVF2_9BILA|nr:Neurotransmitter-gated ion-channel ligand binding domain protein [Ancylostoma ceylanicum]
MRYLFCGVEANYARGAPLSHTGGPVLVTVNIYLRSISKIDDVNMEYSAQFTFREEWVDARLAYGRFEDESTEVPPFVVLATSENADQSQQIWMPDTFFQNEKEARRHLIDKPNVLIRIHKDGSILYSVRLSLVLSCPMSLEFYPLDRQNCLIDLASSWVVQSTWKNKGVREFITCNPICNSKQ